MKKQNLILSAALAAAFSASTAFAEAEVTGKIVHESAKFTTSGTTIGAAAAHGKDVFKQETSARIYIDGEIDEVSEGSTYHVELNLMRDSKGVGKYDGNESYTQRDALREAYVDTTVEDWSIRAGKQQVVWGTADGMKLLDMINPSDYSEMAQNQMEDSRIPVWMINAETTNEDGSEFQVVVSQPRENIFAGMNRNISTSVRVNNPATGADLTTAAGQDQGSAFVMKGVDTITGKTNGFLNGVPDLGSIAGGFAGVFTGANLVAAGQGGNTVKSFADLTTGQPTGFNGMAAGPNAAAFTGMSNAGSTGTEILAGFSTPYDFNLINATGGYSNTNPDSMFEYMDRTSFASFAAYSGAGSQYKYNMPSDTDVNLALKTKNSLDSGLNYSLNYSYNYDTNPVIDLEWQNASGTKLDVVYTDANAGAADSTGISLTEGSNYYGASTSGTASSGAAILTFTETLKRAHNIGGSFDMAIETKDLGPVVLRGEALYQKDVYSPVFNRGKLAIGDLVGALNMTKGDRFKYVLGADITALTNMMISAQFIQDRNLDYVDNNLDWNGTACTAADGVNCGTYTADFATMHMSNNFNKAEENKEFYSLFFSKPFGASGEHRWNNITMYEENGGKWNRLDAEFSIDDDTQATVEYNKYWGNANTQFGQLEKSSNIQVGVKYSF
jgi:hypothetical protein